MLRIGSQHESGASSLKALASSFAVAGLILALGWLVHYRTALDTERRLLAEQEKVVREQKYLVQSMLDDLASSSNLLAYISADQFQHSANDSALTRNLLRDEHLAFLRSRGTFDQLQIVKPSGERILNITRVSRNNGAYTFEDVSTDNDLAAANEPWLPELLENAAPEKAIFLGIHPAASESQRLPGVVRVGSPIYGSEAGVPVAFVVLDYPIDRILKRISSEDARWNGTTYLADSTGRWIGNEDDLSAPPRVGSQQWNYASLPLTGSLSTDNQGFFSYDTIRIGQSGGQSSLRNPQSWKILSWLRPETIEQRRHESTSLLWWIVAGCVGLLVPTTYVLVTAREQHREAARSREDTRALLQSITDSSLDGIVAGEAIRDARGDIKDFRLVFYNPAAESILRNAIVDREHPWSSTEFPLSFSPDFFGRCVHVTMSGSRYEMEHSTETGPLGRVWFRITVVKLNDGVVLTLSDITQQKLTVHEMQQAKDAAEIANRAKSQFLALMGHEIRTPMNGLLGFASLLERTPLNKEQSDYVSTLRMSGEALLRILEDILDYSHMEYEALDMKRVPVDIREVVRQISQLFVLASSDRSIELVTKVEQDVPAQILGDDVRIRQILVNLVGNAVKFTKEGFILIKVSMTSSEAGDKVTFHVVDSGPGVPTEMIDRLFKPFSQVDPSFTRRFGGTGLGLSICKRLVETMGGEISVQTAPGKGSDFFFSLPIRTPDFPALAASPTQLSTSGEQNPATILVVDDDPINRKLMLHMIDKLGSVAQAVSSGEQALAAFTSGKFELILMDIQMPEMDGLETTRQIRGIESREGLHPVRISAVTANSADSDRTACFTAGMDDFLAKPIHLEELEKVVQRAVASARISG
ncbi:signal transduction histidine kinase [Terrimicrobium sacchariphilum]|uniref:histidine kinase n=1 Tax=Terrimicrobium sacchariphilum TaxID=690879 RepID=A0A146G2T2_TERSA|nr:signal transduction histidine kinase [Terrimicrobium sacchariphilum]